LGETDESNDKSTEQGSMQFPRKVAVKGKMGQYEFRMGSTGCKKKKRIGKKGRKCAATKHSLGRGGNCPHVAGKTKGSRDMRKKSLTAGGGRSKTMEIVSHHEQGKKGGKTKQNLPPGQKKN